MLNNKFSSGPCVKPKALKPIPVDLLGRSHRSPEGLARIQYLIKKTRELLLIPSDYHVALVGGSASNAMEMLLWSLIDPTRAVDVLASCTFSGLWADDLQNQLRVGNVKRINSTFGALSGIEALDFSHDVVFCWTGTTTGVSVNNTDWIKGDRTGLTICDAASAVFCSNIDWNKLDATAFSWQKGLGGEAGTGVIVLSPRAIERLETYIPKWPMPRTFRLAVNGKINFDVYDGKTINTPSMMTIEDFIRCLDWAESIGGLSGTIKKVNENYSFMKNWESSQEIFKFIVNDEKHRARNVLCFDIRKQEYQELTDERKWSYLSERLKSVAKAGIAYDILGHILTKPHIRIWCGPTIDVEDLQKLTSELPKYFA